jgi:hypothetical protein
MEAAQASTSFGAVAEMLFGEDAYSDPSLPRPLVKDELHRLIYSYVANIWNNIRRKVIRHDKHLNEGKEQVQEEFDSAWRVSAYNRKWRADELTYTELNAIAPGVKLKASQLGQWLKKIDCLKVLANGFNDKEWVVVLNAQMERLNLVYTLLTGEENPEVTKGERYAR